ncbi:conserved hypothetical protein [Echinococcus multilocularis]|uniref:Uncharacterized protein n=1 Tax=Echinococcus multilocularis TaxID=6211 RepID=A0A087W1C1_ECHMU|nr:conserved hypothetical protein [Echinococcus multilocularis]
MVISSHPCHLLKDKSLADMTSTTDTDNDKTVSELDRESQEIRSTSTSAEQTQMQVARKEGSSGFMLLSVKHLSTVKNIANTNGREVNTLDDCYAGSCIAKTSSLQMINKTVKGNSLELGRHYSSTISLEAEEYDNDEEEELDSHSEPHQLLQSNPQTGFHPQSFVVQNPPQDYIPARVENAKCCANGSQLVDGVKPVVVSNLQPVQVPLASAPIQTSVAQSPYDIPPQATNEQVPNTSNHPVLFRQINLDVASSALPESPLAPSSANVPSNSAGTQVQQSIHHQELPASKFSDPPFDPSTCPAVASGIAVSSQVPGPNHPNTSATLSQPPTQSFIEKLNGEPLRSISDASFVNHLLPSLNAPIQPASRFRKARIHETIEQWDSNRLSFHDRRLKAVPDWVSYLNNKSIDTSFNHPLAQRGRCLYCYVPGSFGSQCNNPKHKRNGFRGSALKHQRRVPCSLPTVPESSELSHILHATFAAYHSAAQQGYNLSSLLTTWDAGERVSNHALLEQVDGPSLKNNLGLKANASNLALLSEHVEMAAHNSTDVNSVLPPGSEDFGTDGITMIARGSAHYQPLPTVVDQPPQTGASPPTVNAGEGADAHVIDPSAAYLRRQLTISAEGEAARFDGGVSHSSQPPSLTTVSAAEQQVAPPASPTMPGKPTCVGRLLVGHRECADAAAASPRTLDSVRSLSGTTIASVQLSPDTEISGMAIPSASDPSAPGRSAPSDAPMWDGHNMPKVLAFSDPAVLGGTSTLFGGGGPGEAVSQAPAGCSGTSVVADTTSSSTATPVDLSAAARNIFQVAAAAAACVNNSPAQPSPQPSGITPSTSSTSTSVSGNLEAQMPKCMDVIRLAIMETLQDQFAHLNSENEALRTAINNLQHENHLLQGYKRAFFDLRRFFQPDVWEQIEQRVRGVEVAAAAAASTESAGQQLFFPPSTQSSQQNSAFQTQPQQQSPSHLPQDAQHPPPPTSNTAAGLPPPPPPPPPQHTAP